MHLIVKGDNVLKFMIYNSKMTDITYANFARIIHMIDFVEFILDGSTFDTIKHS